MKICTSVLIVMINIMEEATNAYDIYKLYNSYTMLSKDFLNSIYKDLIYYGIYQIRGNYNKDGITIKITQSNETYVDDIIFYARSLGLNVHKLNEHITIKHTEDNKYKNKHHKIRY